MGISGLIKRFQGYSEHTTIGCTDGECTSAHSVNPRVIIDGPSLAFFLYHRLLSHKSTVLAPIDANPSYEELGQAVHAFLRLLESCRLKIDKIYFDSHLPKAKQETRVERCRSSLETLLAFKAAYSTGFDLSLRDDSERTIDDDSTSERLYQRIFNQVPTPSVFRGLPFATFLVAATREALAKSDYAPLAKDVPGEADAYCARRARRKGGIVLTTDSDLLVHDLGPNGSLVLLSQLERMVNSKQRSHGILRFTTLRANVFKSHAIAQKLELPNLLGLAYVMSTSSWEIARIMKSKQVPTAAAAEKDDDFHEFHHPYQMILHCEEQKLFHAKQLEIFKTNGELLDSRLAEIVLQVALKGSCAASLYFVPLLEDPSRVSAWAASERERSFAFHLFESWCKSHGFQTKNIQECTRKGQRFVFVASNLDQWTETKEARSKHATFLCKLLEIMIDKFWDAKKAMLWRLVALKLVIDWYGREGRNKPPFTTIVKSIVGSAALWEWEDIHLTAQIHAALYSFRMVKQVLQYMSAEKGTMKWWPQIERLRDTLGGLPEIHQLMPSRFELVDLSGCYANLDWERRLLSLLQLRPGEENET